ncbi:MAG: competence type IV pilus assembly protein ComGB [Vagococcus sp.]|uniref:competence type IV pilus assembly protein ComGB n=1 Tax=Vagococcus sp. TaxID=1933889 RepID=UPI002FCC8040
MGKKIYKKQSKKKESQKRRLFITKHSFSRKEKQAFLILLAELLDNGFTLEKSLIFMMTVNPKRKKELKEMNKRLLAGKSLNKCLKSLCLSESQSAQLSFAEIHGDLTGTLIRMAEHMSDKEKQREHLIKIISYPILLLLFLSSMVLGMKWYILPQLTDLYESSDGKNLGLLVVDNGPVIILISSVIAFILYHLINYYLSKKTAIYQANWLSRVPLLKPFIVHYYTSLFATEWGKLLTQGMEFRDVVLTMNQVGYTPLMQEMAKEIEGQIEEGISIDGPVKEWLFLKPELNLIILQGEVKGNLGKELLIYGKKEWENFINLAEKRMRFLQPLMFLLIAVLIISVYGALLLPIYSGMGELY